MRSAFSVYFRLINIIHVRNGDADLIVHRDLLKHYFYVNEHISHMNAMASQWPLKLAL